MTLGVHKKVERGPSLVGSLGCRAGTIDFCPALAALFGPVQNIIFLTAHFFTLLTPIVLQSGQAVVLGRLSLCPCLYKKKKAPPTRDRGPHSLVSLPPTEGEDQGQGSSSVNEPQMYQLIDVRVGVLLYRCDSEATFLYVHRPANL